MTALAPLLAGWRRLALTAAVPDRCPGWDAVVLTASGPAQADLYRAQLSRLARLGRLPAATRTLVVEDPGGARIGSGGATLNALRQLVAVAGAPARLAAWRVLLVHAGGDSRRMPWASVPGKVFVPVPLLADADQPAPTLLEHILAALAHLPAQLAGGGLVAASGDVLPLCPAEDLAPGALDGLAMVVTPTPLAVAGRHGVAVAGADGVVADLVQKGAPDELLRRGAVLPSGGALIDTGLWLAGGRAFAALAALAARADDPVARLVAIGHEISMYEELCAGAVPALAAWLATRPLGAELAAALAGTRLLALRADRLRFIHLGTADEYLDCITRPWDGLRAARLLSDAAGDADPDAVLVHARLAPGCRVGAGSLVANSRLGGQARIGRRCVVLGVDAEDEPLALPDHHCLWQVAVRGSSGTRWAAAWCGVDDNPKDPLASATLGGRPLTRWIDEHGLAADDLWPAGVPRTLWTAKLYPCAPAPELGAVGWMLGDGRTAGAGAAAWRAAERLSLADLASRADAGALIERGAAHDAALVRARLAAVADGAVDADVGRLARLLGDGARGALTALADHAAAHHPGAAHRRARLVADLLAAAGHDAAPAHAAAWHAVTADLAAALPTDATAPVAGLAGGTSAECTLPVRFDLAGGWSDTPPYCLEHPARVLNLALTLDGALPIGAHAEALAAPQWEIALGDAPFTVLAAPRAIDLADPLALPLAALLQCGYGDAGAISQGVRLRLWSRIPKGSGLGGSSILAAAAVRALRRLAGRDDGVTAVMEQVLLVEQRLTTGGGWQDQLGGLVPGAKLLASVPRRPLSIAIEPIPLADSVRGELEARLVVAHTGIERLAKNVLQRVMGGYLARVRGVVHGIRTLADLAQDGRDRLAAGDFAALGAAMREVWAIHQSLDPHCSNPQVDALFAQCADLADGWKLAGAGGGGFAALLAKDAEAAARLRTRLSGVAGVRVAAARLHLG